MDPGFAHRRRQSPRQGLVPVGATKPLSVRPERLISASGDARQQGQVAHALRLAAQLMGQQREGSMALQGPDCHARAAED